MANDVVIETGPLGFPWATLDPFLFCVHHLDAYPAANEQMGPAASLAGRNIGMDFEGKDGWRMYHGDVVPGFPQHPHRGFETVTLARRGYIDHSDSLGATARFGQGDVQWMTAGRGIVHSEMFPLLDRGGPNTVELFQIWLNLPAEDKLVDPHFTMLWDKDIARHHIVDANGRATHITVVAGAIGDVSVPKPPPKSWASRPDSDVAIWTITLEPNAKATLPPAKPGTNRALYFFRGASVSIGARKLTSHVAARVVPDVELVLENGPEESELLLLQGKPIREAVAQHGPFVMNTPAEIQQAISDYRRTQFGGWAWPSDGPVHPREEGRFAKHADGRTERMG
jgi:redox-sensitive bicupin YhaK (pirin superfamily)